MPTWTPYPDAIQAVINHYYNMGKYNCIVNIGDKSYNIILREPYAQHPVAHEQLMRRVKKEPIMALSSYQV